MTTAAEIKHLQEHGLYSAADEHDACGVGFVAHIKGEKSHAIVLLFLVCPQFNSDKKTQDLIGI